MRGRRTYRYLPLTFVAAMLPRLLGPMAGSTVDFPGWRPRVSRPARTYKPNSGTRAQERYRRRIALGRIPEDQIWRGE